jgi:hypothetical protein
MKKAISMLTLLAGFLMLQGCASAPHFIPVANVPPDKALIYIYRNQNYVGSGVDFKIFANHNPVTMLTASGLITDNIYYPYVATPGEIAFTGQRMSHGEMHLFDFVYSQDKLADLQVIRHV